ncbi:hypothetical protein DIC82_13735 [Clostridium beijerinckii]|nr:hypothetical protein DIC82_13735 [Clostridium beijerinckii]
MYTIKSLEIFNLNNEVNFDLQNYKLNKNLNFIDACGQCFLKLFIELSNLNESDRFAILLDNKIICTKKLSVRKSYSLKIEIPLVDFNEYSNINCINNSDDLFIANTIKGGLYMADPAVFSIVNIDNANNKSFDLTLSEPFSSEFTASIESLDTKIQYPCSLVTNSLFPNDSLKKTLIIGKIDYLNPIITDKSLIDLIVPTNQTYRITIYKNNVTNDSTSKDIKLIPYKAISDPKTDVKIFITGDRIAQISFINPIRNAFDSVPVDANGEPITTGTPAANILSNFYALYYNRETNRSINPTQGKWSGAFNIDRKSFSANLSSDGKTLILQDNILSLPLTENVSHILAINKGKYHLSQTDKTKVLTDYSEEQRIVPMMEIGFDVRISATPALPISAIAPVRNQVTVTFSDAVMKPFDTTSNPISNANILFINGTALKLSSVTRVSGSFKDLIFTLDSSNALPSGPITLGIGSPNIGSGDLVDACGYIVPLTTLSVNVGSIPPKLVSAIQDQDPTYTDNTVINLTFSAQMNDDVSGTGANNLANYMFVDSKGISQTIQSAAFIAGTNNSSVKIIFKNLLGAGLYNLIINANAITDIIGENIYYTNYPVSIEDTTKPSVIEIIGLNSENNSVITDKSNALIIKYKTPMNVIGGSIDNARAADRPDNYKFEESNLPATNAPLPIGTLTTPLNNNSWIRFILPVSSSYPVFENSDTLNGNPNTNYNIYIGYTGLYTINYVCNTSGNIYPLCEVEKIDATVPLIDLSKGKVEITSDSELKFTYTDGSTVNNKFYHNQFNNIAKSDFLIGVSNSAITTPINDPLSIKGISLSQDGTAITFTFDQNTFTSAYKFAYVGGSANNAIQDIFGKGIVAGSNFNGNVINSVPSTLVGISLTDIRRTMEGTGYPVTIALKFSNIIKNTNPSDFLMTFNNQINIPINSAIAYNDTIIITASIPSVAIDELDNIISIRTSADSPFISTKDINNNTIKPFNYTPVMNLSVSNSSMNFVTANDLNASSLNCVFNRELDFTSGSLLAVKNAGATGLIIGGDNGISFTIVDSNGKLTKPYIDLVSGTDKLGRITLTKVDPNKEIFNSATNTALNINIKQGNTNSELILTFTKFTDTDDSTLNISNLAYIEYTGESLVFMDTTKSLYVNTSLDYNANATLK